MGNGCAAPVTVRWSNPRMVVRNRAVRLSHAKNGEKVDLERTGRLDETAQFDQPASIPQMLASEHLIQNGAVELRPNCLSASNFDHFWNGDQSESSLCVPLRTLGFGGERGVKRSKPPRRREHREYAESD